MKKLSYVALAALGVALSAGQASAEELWNPHLRGVDEGLAAGAVPPKGVYFVDDNYYASFRMYDGSGKSTPTRLDVFVDVPIVLWNTGLKVFGGDFAVAAAQPFDYTNVIATGLPSSNAHWGTFNTVLIPAIVSWALPSDFHVKGSLGINLDDASSSPSKPPANGGAGAGNAGTTFEPGLGISWLHDGWNISAQFLYDTTTKDNHTNYQSGDQFSGDYTISKAFGKWSFGVGGYSTNQLEKDTVNGKDAAGTTRLTYGVGPVASYTFGGIIVQAQYDYNITTHNDFGGDVFNVRFVVPID